MACAGFMLVYAVYIEIGCKQREGELVMYMIFKIVGENLVVTGRAGEFNFTRPIVWENYNTALEVCNNMQVKQPKAKYVVREVEIF